MALRPRDQSPLVCHMADAQSATDRDASTDVTGGSSRKQTQLRQAQHPIDSNTNQYGVYTSYTLNISSVPFNTLISCSSTSILTNLTFGGVSFLHIHTSILSRKWSPRQNRGDSLLNPRGPSGNRVFIIPILWQYKLNYHFTSKL